MGADNFSNTATAKTAREAFKALVTEARYMNGNDGYTGTIAEKSNFKMVDVDRAAEWAIEKVKARRASLTVKAQSKLPHYLQVYVHGEKLAVTCARMRKEATKELRALQSKRNKAAAVARAMIDYEHPDVEDKYGPACCVQIGRKGELNKYAFFGVAAS